jgi:hypothetical protein
MTFPKFTPPIAGLVAVVLIVSSFAAGWITRGWRDAKADLKTVQAQVRADAQETARRQSIGVRYEEERAAIDVHYRVLPDWWPRLVAQRPDLADVDIGPDGLCEWNRWNAGPAADFTCVAGEGQDGTAASTQREAARPHGEP